MPEPGDDGLDRLIESLYSGVVELSGPPFRGLALERLCAWCGAAGAAWLTQTDHGEDAGFASWPAPVSAARIAAIAFASGQRRVPVAIEPSWFARAGGDGSALAFRLVHRGTTLHSIVLLCFGEPPRVDDALLQRALGHLVQAGSLALQQLIQRDEWLQAMGRHSRGSAALVDDSGRIVIASRRFLDLLPGGGGEAGDRRLPFPLPAEAVAAGSGEFAVERLHFRLRRSDGLLLLNAREPHPLDSLSAREQQIARELAAGKTFKSIAREYDIAVSTVANHASRIYRKLGLFRREELVGLLRTAATA
jgi:DNA-binding CsgD family transcriptional regulator